MTIKKIIEKKFHDYDKDLDGIWVNDPNYEKKLDEIASHIGWIIINLNSLEDTIAFCIKELMSDSGPGDELNLIFQSELSYASKYKMLVKIYGWFIAQLLEGEKRMKMLHKLEILNKSLKRAGELRNQYAHADWSDISQKRFVKIKTKSKRDGVYHVYRQFEIPDMVNDIEFIDSAQQKLDDYDEELHDLLNSY